MDPIDFIDKLNGLYSNAFGHLITITIIIMTSYLALPFILTLIQNRSLKSERKKLEDEIEKKIIEYKTELRTELENMVEIERVKISEELNASIALTQGNVYFQQGIRCFKDDSYVVAAKSFASSIGYGLDGNNERNARVSFNWLYKTMPFIKRKSFDNDDEFESYFTDLLAKLDDLNINKRFSEDIRVIRKAVKEAKERQ